jgi:signal transduction histidine kinase
VLTDHEDIDRAVEILLTAQRMAADGLTETRRAVHALRSDSRPLDEELSRATATYGERYDVKVSLAIGGTPRPAPPDATVALLRTAQEALVNAAKHAPGQCVAVRLDYGAHDVRLTVVNGLASEGSGPAGPGTITGGYGLTGMRERLRLLNGTLAAGPGDRQWTVTAELPLAPADQPLAFADQPKEVTS